MSAAAFVARLVLAAVFMVAGAAKRRRRVQFERAVRAYEVGGDRVVALLASFLPAVEVSAGALLLFGLATQPAAVVVAGLLIVFIAASVRQLVRGRDIECGCFGSAGMHRLSWLGVARNAALLALTMLVAARPVTAFGLDQIVLHQKSVVTATDAVTLIEAIAAGLLTAALIRAAFRLVRLDHQFDPNRGRG